MVTTHPQRPYAANNLFTYSGQWSGKNYSTELQNKLGAPDGYEQFDLAIIEVDEKGDFLYPQQLENIGDRIESVRKHSHAIVVGFIHGWHNNADWDNKNLEVFVNY